MNERSVPIACPLRWSAGGEYRSGFPRFKAGLEAQDDAYEWPEFDENSAASLCYTSGATGNPKGVLYSHRSTLLHSYAGALPDALNCSSCGVILPVVPIPCQRLEPALHLNCCRAAQPIGASPIAWTGRNFLSPLARIGTIHQALLRQYALVISLT
jgi:hypothetical protein